MYSAKRIDNVALGFYVPASGWKVLNSITNASFAYDAPQANLNILGRPTDKMIMDGPVNTSLSFTKNITSDDEIMSYTGVKGLRFHMASDYSSTTSTSGISVTGAISTISVSATIGEVPSMSVDALLYSDDFYSIETVTVGSAESENVYIPSTGIQLNVGGQNGSNAIAGANFSANFNWRKEGRINDSVSSGRFSMELARPIEYTASVEIVVDDYRMDAFAFSNPKTWELKIYSDTALIETFTMENAELIGESLSLTDGLPTVSLQYKGVG